MRIEKFDTKAILALEYYVYMLIDPETNIPFYVGKGVNNRVFQHLECALEENEVNNAKYDKILEIQKKGQIVKHIIVRHGIKNEEESYRIEASLIDALNYCGLGLSNITSGHNSLQKGLMTTDEIIRMYKGEKLSSISSDCIIININIKYPKRRNAFNLTIYEATKETWTIDKNKKNSIKYVLSEYKGLIVEVFEVIDWYEKERGYMNTSKKFGETKIGYGFNGKIANDHIRNLYLNKSIQHIKKKGAASVIRYKI